MNRLRLPAALFGALVLLAPVVSANTKKGDKLLKEGAQAEQAKDYDKAIQLYGQALKLDPQDVAYQMADRRARARSAEVHVNDGVKLRDQQKVEEALVEFQKAYLTDPSYVVALQEMRSTEAMLKERDKAPAGTAVLTPAQKAQQAINNRISSLEPPPELRPLNNQITNLRMNNQSMRVLYETVGKLAGINILFDSSPGGGDLGGGPGGQRNFNLDLNRVTLSEALDYIALLTHTFWKPISNNAIFVATDSAQKRQEYQDQVVKVFYVQNVGAQAEFQDFFNAVRTGANMTRGLIQLPSQNALIARGTSDQIAVVEKIIHDLDRPKAEVLIDVVVMEVNKVYQRTLAAALAGATNGLNVPIKFTPRNPTLFGNNNNNNSSNNNNSNNNNNNNNNNSSSTNTNTPQYISLAKLGKISTNDFSISLPGALVQALLQDNSTRVLQRPQLRATDGGKASLKIGSKIPYVSGSLNSAIATPGSIPYATTQFQQVDVGVILDMQPHVNGPDDISMKVKIEISQVSGNTEIAGVQQPIISQRVNEADIRLRNGEVSVLGGLTNNSDTNNSNGIPGLVNMPLLGYLFGTRYREKDRDEILIALIPHIIRAPDLTVIGEDPIQTGTETTFRVLRAAPSDGGQGSNQAAPQPALQQQAPAPGPAQPQSASPQNASPQNAPPQNTSPQNTPPQNAPAQQPPPAGVPIPARPVPNNPAPNRQ